MDHKYRRGFFLISWLVKRVRKKKEICLQTIRTTIILLKSVHYLPNAFKLFISWSNAWKISVICFRWKRKCLESFLSEARIPPVSRFLFFTISFHSIWPHNWPWIKSTTPKFIPSFWVMDNSFDLFWPTLLWIPALPWEESTRLEEVMKRVSVDRREAAELLYSRVLVWEMRKEQSRLLKVKKGF